jgi:hypothetical protein
MERLIDRQQMRQVVSVRVDEVVDPLDAHGLPPRRLDRERRVVKAGRMVHRAVTPDCRRQPHAVRKNVLPELTYGDLVVIDTLPRLHRHLRRTRHRRRNHQRGHVLRDAARRERPTGHLCERLPRADSKRQEQDRAARSAVLEQLSTRDPVHLGLNPRRRHSGEHPVLPVGVGSFEHRAADAAPPASGAVPLCGAASASPPIRFDHSPQQHVNAVALMQQVCHSERRR